MANQLLLLQDVDSLGRKGDIVHTRPGYFRNFLQPKGLAVAADKGALRMRERLQKERLEQAVQDKADSEKLAAALSETALSTIVKIDQDGKLYGSVSVSDVLALFAAQGISLSKKNVVLAHAIKTLGEHKITVKLLEGVTATVRLDVLPDTPVVQAEVNKE